MVSGSNNPQQPVNIQANEMKQILQALRSDISIDADIKLLETITRLITKLELKYKGNEYDISENSVDFQLSSPITTTTEVTKESKKSKEILSKEFRIRNSPLTNLKANIHFCSVCNIFAAFFILFHINMVVWYCLDAEKFKYDFTLVIWAFSGMHIVFFTWFGLFLSMVFLLYPTFCFWANTRALIRSKSLFDLFFFVLWIIYEFALIWIPLSISVYFDLTPASALIFADMQVVMIMKSYAFVRENVTRVLNYKKHQDGEEKYSKPLPSVYRLIYFLIAPVLVYRDYYPRAHYIRWRYVAWNVLQTGACTVGTVIMYINFVMDDFKCAGLEPISLSSFGKKLTISIFVGAALQFLSFYGVFHCMLNILAEITRFGDRMYYGDWWNATSFDYYYRTWSTIIKDWLHEYIYQDINYVLKGSKSGGVLLVFVISSIFHEFVLASGLRFVLPLLFALFLTFGVLFSFVTLKSKSSFWNIFIWAVMFQGWGLLSVFYSLEWYSRQNCPRTIDSWLDYVTPRFLKCDVIDFSS